MHFDRDDIAQCPDERGFNGARLLSRHHCIDHDRLAVNYGVVSAAQFQFKFTLVFLLNCIFEPDVVFIKRGVEWVVTMNEEDLPSLRLSQRYRRMLVAEGTEKEVKEYVKERFRSALQLMRNIAQRKSTILRTCEVIVRRQQDFLDQGIEALRPMMIKEVAEEIGVHPSTVSRAVANKYAHTPQGVIELRFFFSEGSNGPEGADTPLLVLKRKVRKLIEDEDARHPLTDDQLAAMLQSQGHSAHPAHRRQISRGHEHTVDAPAPPPRRLRPRFSLHARISPTQRPMTPL